MRAHQATEQRTSTCVRRDAHSTAPALGRPECLWVEEWMVQAGRTLTVGGWVKTGREAGGGKWIFLEINDGTSFQSLQAGPPHHRCFCHGMQALHARRLRRVDAPGCMPSRKCLEAAKPWSQRLACASQNSAAASGESLPRAACNHNGLRACNTGRNGLPRNRLEQRALRRQWCPWRWLKRWAGSAASHPPAPVCSCKGS